MTAPEGIACPDRASLASVSRSLLLACAMGSALAILGVCPTAQADEDTALAHYRKIWNPFSAGPELVSSADVQPQGQMFVRPYIYSELAYAQYGDWALRTTALDRKLSSIAPQVEFSYGILDWLEFEMYVPETSWWQGSGDGAGSANGNGLGDITAFVKARFHVQQTTDWLPSLTETLFVTLPTSSWAGSIGTPPIPGGFAPLGRLPSTHFGAPELTEAILDRKSVV